ncbi:aromatic acid exporter family protein [Eubacteriales bacterium OttesenSCG-928-K08]|nr:aromatic acid exporter family protein [Eubacteriales bacterium OttesenSCG-928-K08]
MKIFRLIRYKWLRFLHAHNDLINAHYKVGMRVFKTLLAVTVCLVIAWLTNSSGVLQVSTVSAIICLRPSQEDTKRTGWMRVLGTLVGGIMGLLCAVSGALIPSYYSGWFVLVIPVFMFADLYFCNVFRIPQVSVVSLAALLLVATQEELPIDETLVYAALRIVYTLIGVVVASIVNVIPLQRKGLLREEKEDAAIEAEEEKCTIIEAEK